jgi:O-6-methylguanine DNA methyltransferase
MNVPAAADWTELVIQTADGLFVAGYSQRGLAALTFPHQAATTDKPSVVAEPVTAFHQLTLRALERVLAGRPPGKLPPLDLSGGTEFQQHVWDELRQIPSGQTQTYGQIARAIGKPTAVRAVGGACGANPIPILIPCHRVLAANQKPGGFSGGLTWKRMLLAREGIELTGWKGGMWMDTRVRGLLHMSCDAVCRLRQPFDFRRAIADCATVVVAFVFHRLAAVDGVGQA